MADTEQDNQASVVDWVHLPAGIEETSLWDCLHDGSVDRIELDRLARTLFLQVDVFYIREFHKLPEDARFTLKVSGVQSIRVTYRQAWPGEFEVPKGSSREEAGRLIREYQSKWIETTVSWPEFAAKVDARDGAEIYEGTLAQGPSSTALRLFLNVGDDFYPEFIVRAEHLTISLSSGRELSLQEFLGLGEAYWDDFAERGRKRRGNLEDAAE